VVSSIVVGLLWTVSPTWAMSFVILMSLAGAVVIATSHPHVRQEPGS
jgi:hypothetical protein